MERQLLQLLRQKFARHIPPTALAMANKSLSISLRRAVVLACGALAFASCTHVSTENESASGAGTSEHNAFTRSHELRVALQGDVSSLNTLLTTEAEAMWMDNLTMAWLVRFDHNNEPIPELATVVPTQANHGISADGKTITYHLRKDAKWSDGKPFSADDIAFTARIINDPRTNIPSRQGWDQIVRTDEPNKYTIVFHLKAPYSPFVETAFASGGGSPPVLPERLLEHTRNINTDPYNSLPVGIGPFKFAKWARADAIEMVANPYYFRGRPKLDKITFKIIPNRDTIVAELQTGELDLWSHAAPAYLSRVKALHGYHLLRQPSYGFGHLDFNTSHPGISDPVVRRALLLAWDRREQRSKISHGVGILQDSIFSPRSPYFDPKIGFTEMNPANANALLDGAGWKRGADGIRVKDGVRLNLEFVANTGSPDTDERIELLRQDWKAIGVSFTLKKYAPNQLLASMQENGIIQTGKFDVVVFGWFPPASGDQSITYGCKQNPPIGQNDLHWCDARADAAMQDFIVTYDEPRKKRDAAIFQEELQRSAPTIVSVMSEDLYVENDDLKNFRPNNVSPYDDIMNVDI